MASKTDAVCLALTALWTAALTGIQVADGPQVNSEAGNDWLFVGSGGDLPEESNEAAVVEQSLMAFARTKQEDGQVTCAVVSRSGDTDIPALRARAYGFLSAAEGALRADMQLGGLVMHAFISSHIYSPVQMKPGAKVRVVFTVTYQAQL